MTGVRSPPPTLDAIVWFTEKQLKKESVPYQATEDCTYVEVDGDTEVVRMIADLMTHHRRLEAHSTREIIKIKGEKGGTQVQ